MDTVLKLRELRARAGLTQEDVARRSGVGVKTISSFESGARVASMKLAQLESILAVYGVTLEQFFSPELASELAPWQRVEERPSSLARDLAALPSHVRTAVAEKIRTLIELARGLSPQRISPTRERSPHAAHHAHPRPAVFG